MYLLHSLYAYRPCGNLLPYQHRVQKFAVGEETLVPAQDMVHGLTEQATHKVTLVWNGRALLWWDKR